MGRLERTGMMGMTTGMGMVMDMPPPMASVS